MDYITIKEASEKWGMSTRAITYQVVAGRINGADDRHKYNRRRTKKEEPAQ